MTYNICTLSDINFLPQGLVLYKSLKETSKNKIKLFYLCLDEETTNVLKKLNFEDIEIITISELIGTDEKLKSLRDSENDSPYGKYWEFCWTLASYLSNYLLDKGLEHIYYIDSDICFYKDIELISNEINGRDIGLFRHRMFELDSQRPEGLFNVGVVYFKGSQIGKEACFWWKDAVLWRKYPEYATCSDQKYLEAFLKMFPKECIYVDENIGHGAPWHWILYNCNDLDKGYIEWKGKKQPFVFSHFSSFKYDDNKFECSTRHSGWTNNDTIFKLPKIYKLHSNYFKAIKLVKENWIKNI